MGGGEEEEGGEDPRYRNGQDMEDGAQEPVGGGRGAVSGDSSGQRGHGQKEQECGDLAGGLLIIDGQVLYVPEGDEGVHRRQIQPADRQKDED